MRLFRGPNNVEKLMTRRNDKIIESLRKDRLVKKEVEKATTKLDSLKPHTHHTFKDAGRGWLHCECGSFKWVCTGCGKEWDQSWKSQECPKCQKKVSKK